MSKKKKAEESAEKARVQDFMKMNLAPGTITKVPIAHIRPNPEQPRKFFYEGDLGVLSDSIEGGDVDCPIHVTMKKTHVLIIDGERRYRAALRAKLSHISCQIFSDMDDKNVHLRSARANFGKKDMSPVETARAIKKIMDDFGWSQAEAARWASMHQTQVSQLMKYLNLSPEIQKMLIEGEITNGMSLIVACYPREHQQGILKKMLEERAKFGGRIEQNTASRIAKMTAEEQGFVPHKRGTRGRKATLSHTDAVVKNLVSKATSLEKALSEVVSAEKAAGSAEKFFKQLKIVNVLEVMRVLKDLGIKLQHTTQSIDSVA